MTGQGTASALAEKLTAMSGTLSRLTTLSREKYQNPYVALSWPASLDPAADLCFTPELSSLFQTPHSVQPDDESVRRLAFQEAANFFSLNIHGEKALMAGLAKRLYRSDLGPLADYLHHFIDEENKHSVYFGGFCHRYARVYPSRHVSFPDSPEREVSDLLFFTKVLIFEEIADRYNVLQGEDTRLHEVARFINTAHHADESRHLVFNKAIVKAFWDVYSPGWDEETLARIRAYVGQFLVTTWREYYNPDVYADRGFGQPWQVADDAWATSAQREHRRRISAKCLRFLLSSGVLLEEPADVF